MSIRARLSASVAVFCLPFAAAAQTAETNDEEIEEIIVTGEVSRLPESLLTFPGSVTRIGREDIDAVQAIYNDPVQLLNLLAPGMGTAAPASASNFEQTLRGRKATVLIDGVPISTPLRDGRHDIRSLSLTALHSVEIIRGATAIYGNGGAGGVINYITRRPRDEKPQFLSEAGIDLSLTQVDDSLAPFVHQAAWGSVGDFDYVADAYYKKTNSFFDSDGDRIRPSPQGQGGLADSDIFSLYGKLGYNFGRQRIEASVLYYDQEQDTAFNVIIPGDSEAGEKTRVRRGPPAPGEANPANENLVLNLVYSHADVLGSHVRAQVFYQDFTNVFDFSETFFPGGGQSTVLSEKWGSRLDISTPIDLGNLISDGTLLWGADFLNDETAQPLVDGRIWAPPVDQTSYAFFAQARLPIGERFELSGGVRHEEVEVEFPSFTALFSGVQVQAGETDYSQTTFNVGGSVKILDPLVFYLSFSQGFSVAEVGRLLRQAGETTDFSEAQLEASVVDNYEAGLRLELGDYRVNVAAFRTASDLGTTITTDLRIAREKEETFGAELAIEAQPSDDWRWGLTFTWIGGNRDADRDGDFDRPLPSNVVPPAKLTGFIEHRISEIWSFRLQALHNAGRDKFEEIRAFGEGEIDPFQVVDASARADLGRFGAVTLGISNLFNEDYFPVGSQLFRGINDTGFTEAPGTAAKLTYAIRY